jgi:hypothetical protein
LGLDRKRPASNQNDANAPKLTLDLGVLRKLYAQESVYKALGFPWHERLIPAGKGGSHQDVGRGTSVIIEHLRASAYRPMCLKGIELGVAAFPHANELGVSHE